MSFIGAIPLLFVVCVILFAGTLEYNRWRKRENVFGLLVQKYGLQRMWGWGSAPDPEIRGAIFGADYPRYIEGRVQGVPVVAFDYRIGFGRGRLYGAGVGMKRQVLQPDKLVPRMVARQKDGWTFVFTDPYKFWRWGRPEAEDMEWMWRVLLAASAREPDVQVQLEESVPGEVHIRPRRLREQ